MRSFLAYSCLAVIISGKVQRGVRGPASVENGAEFRELDPNLAGKPQGKNNGVENWYDKTYLNDNQYYYRHIQNNNEPNRWSKDHSDSTVQKVTKE